MEQGWYSDLFPTKRHLESKAHVEISQMESQTIMRVFGNIQYLGENQRAA